MTTPRYTGVDADGVVRTEADHADHFGNCPVCGAFVDMRDLAQILDHVHGVKIEISEAPCSAKEPIMHVAVDAKYIRGEFCADAEEEKYQVDAPRR